MEDLIRNKKLMEGLMEMEAYKIIVERIQAEIDSLKPAYECESVDEIKYIKGYYDGLNFLTSFVEGTIGLGNIKQNKQDESPEEPKII